MPHRRSRDPHASWRAIAAFLLIGLPAAVHATTFVVHPDGSGDFATIQAALTAAASGDSILLGDGVFTGAGNRDLNYLAKTLVVRSQSGDPATCTIDCENLGRGVTFVSVSSRDATLGAVTITNGIGDGGAIYCEHSSPTIEGCVLTGNGTTDRGGGVHCRLSSMPLITGCLITDNHAQAGGGVYCYSAGAEIVETTISDNTSNGNGAGIWMNVSASVILTDSHVTSNVAGGWGGGVWCSGTFATPSSLVVARSALAGNDAEQGGGILCIGMAPTFTLTSLTGNRASVSDGGGALFFDSDPSFVRCTVSGNHTAGSGGGLTLNGSTAVFDHVVFWGDCASAMGDEMHTMGTGAAAGFFCSDISPGAVSGTGSITIDGNSIDADPLFCAPELCDAAPIPDGDYALQPGSPADDPVCGLIGAYDVGCSAISVPDARPRVVASVAAPNPTRGTLRIDFTGSASAMGADVAVFDTRGRLVREWRRVSLAGGRGHVSWDGADDRGLDVPAGLYFYRVRMGTAESVGRISLVG